MSEVWYDLEPASDNLRVVAGPPGYNPYDLKERLQLPEGFRWVSQEEWDRRRPEVEYIPKVCLTPGVGVPARFERPMDSRRSAGQQAKVVE